MNDQAKGSAQKQKSESASKLAEESFTTMSHAFSNWLRNANRMQTETIRFMSERFNKDMLAFSRFGECKKPEEFAQVHSELVTQMVNDYMEEGTKLVALFGDLAQSAVTDPPAAAKKQ